MAARTKKAKAPTGRPSSFTPEIAEAICDLLMDGLSLRKICLRDDMPDRSTVHRWLSDDAVFATRCAHARELQADLMDDKIQETADACTPETAVADRVKISAYQWRASKLAPKKYGDKVALVGGDPKSDEPIKFEGFRRIIVHARPDEPERHRDGSGV